MNVLVTGGAGFIGSHLVEALLTRGHRVSVIDDFNDFYDPVIKEKNLEAIRSQINVHKVDIRNRKAVADAVSAENPEAIVHLAGRAGVRPSVQDPELYLDTNVKGTFHLLEAAKNAGVGRFIFASSSSVYGASKEVPFCESQALSQTLSPYAATKLAGEHLSSNYSYLYGLRVICLRFFTVYGPRQRPDLAIHKFTRLIHSGKPIDVYGDGTARRDFTYIDDIIQGILGSLEYNLELFDVFNLGESDTIEVRQMIAELEAVLGRTATIHSLPPMPGDMLATYADVSKARRLLGYTPKTRFQEGLPKFVDWYLRTQTI